MYVDSPTETVAPTRPDTDKQKLLLRRLKVKFHYASWFEAGSKLVRSWSATSFEPVCNQLRTSFEPASVMEFVWL